MQYYLKRCGFQELGSVGPDGKPKRGRYLMSSKNKAVLEFFPQLSKEIPNDTIVLPLIPLFLGKKTYCSYVYHNSKFTGTQASHPRNEYRIYLNNEIEGHQLYFSAGDIVVFRKCSEAIHDLDGKPENAYYVAVLKDHQSSEYFTASKIIEQSPIQGAYGMYEGSLPFIESAITQFEAGSFILDVSLDPSVAKQIEGSSEESQKNIFNAATFRDFVLAGYNNACAITGLKSDSVFSEGIDVVYIRPPETGGSFKPDNGIALSHDYSMAFVQGRFTLSDDYEIIVHPDEKDERLNNQNHTQIRVPAFEMFRPSLENLKYHRDRIFGVYHSAEDSE